MDLELLKMCDLTITGLESIKLYCRMIAIYTKGHEIIEILHN